jgi:hypothetical protein
MGDGADFCVVRYPEIHAAIGGRHCRIYLPQPVCFLAIHIRNPGRGLSAGRNRTDNGGVTCSRSIRPGFVSHRILDGRWHFHDYVVVFLYDAGSGEMEPVHGSYRMEPRWRIFVQGHRASLRLPGPVLSISAQIADQPSSKVKFCRVRRMFDGLKADVYPGIR